MRQNIESLVTQGRYREAASALESLPSLSLSQKVLRAYTRSECEGAAAAADEALHLLPTLLTATDRAYCLDIPARASAGQGDVPNALRLLEGAIREVDGNVSPSARLEIRLAGSLLSWIGIEPVLARLPQLRRSVTASGDAFAAIGFHLICAEVHVKRYSKANAEQQLAIAAGLLEAFPHLRHQAKLLQLRPNYAAMCSEFAAALGLAEACLERCAEAGWRAGRTTMLGNICYISVLTGELDKAEDFLRRSTEHVRADSPVGVGFAANELELALAKGEMERASEVASELQERSSKIEGGYSYRGVVAPFRQNALVDPNGTIR